MTELTKKLPFNFMKVYDVKRTKDFESKIDPNPRITKKGKKINLRDYVNEGFEAADLMTNLKKFGSVEKIKKEQAFLMLDDILLNADYRDVLDIQKQGKIAYNQLAIEERRNLTENDFLRDYKTFKNSEKKVEVKVEADIDNSNKKGE